uniref:Uncharacterized protein n=1 Tax=Trichobilharzia regenti TaxID=157069 RepID=A0AA85IQ78_TRIRE|nr:unnamed protein product [Trichobilharzia regenti]
MSSIAYRPSECNRFRSTSSTDKLQDTRQTLLCFTRLQEVHKMMNCESVSKFSDKLNVKSRSDSELCDDNGVIKKPVFATESSSDSTSLQGITSQSEGIKSLGICEVERESSIVVIKGFKNDEVDQVDDGKWNICDNGRDSADFSSVDHDEMRGLPTTARLNIVSVQLQRLLGLNVFAEGMDTCETVNVIDQRVAHLSSDASAKAELIMKYRSGGNLAVRQLSESRTTTASDPPLSSSTGINQLPSVLSSTMRRTPINSSILCNDYDSIGAFEKTKDIAQFSEDKPSVNERIIVKFTCMNTGISSFKLLFECYYHPILQEQQYTN